MGSLLIENNNSEKGYLWVDDERREAFEFDLPRPHPEGARRIIDFVTKRNHLHLQKVTKWLGDNIGDLADLG